MGAPTAVQYLISGAIIAAGVGLRRVPLHRRRSAAPPRPDTGAPDPARAVAAVTSTPPRRSAR